MGQGLECTVHSANRRCSGWTFASLELFATLLLGWMTKFAWIWKPRKELQEIKVKKINKFKASKYDLLLYLYTNARSTRIKNGDDWELEVPIFIWLNKNIPGVHHLRFILLFYRDEAEMEYLKIAQDLEMYGVNYFLIRVRIQWLLSCIVATSQSISNKKKKMK